MRLHWFKEKVLAVHHPQQLITSRGFKIRWTSELQDLWKRDNFIVTSLVLLTPQFPKVLLMQRHKSFKRQQWANKFINHLWSAQEGVSYKLQVVGANSRKGKQKLEADLNWSWHSSLRMRSWGTAVLFYTLLSFLSFLGGSFIMFTIRKKKKKFAFYGAAWGL